METYGAGSAYFLYGDDITDADELETRVLEVVSLFRPKAAVQRLFIDEISAVPNWERALKLIADRGQLRVPEYFFEIIRDWIIGEMVRSGRSRQFLLALRRTLFA